MIRLPYLVTAVFLSAPLYAQTTQGEGIRRLIQVVEDLEKTKEPKKEISGHLPVDTPKKAPLSPATLRAMESAAKSAQTIQDLKIPKELRDRLLNQKNLWDNNSLESYVRAAPPRDQELMRSVLMGDQTEAGTGRLIYFVSRSMPPSLLKAYALDAFHTGASLVVKGVRKGDTLKEFVEEALEDFNTSNGTGLATLELNPNLFDTFKITVVPTVVWTNKTGLDSQGSGCVEYAPDAQGTSLSLPGPDDTVVVVKKPACLPAAPTAYYKIAGALTTPYALDRFQEAGAPKDAINHFRLLLADGRAQAGIPPTAFKQTFNNAMPAVVADYEIKKMPRRVLEGWKEALASNTPVRKTPWGPAFGADGGDDPEYRKELEALVQRGLGED